ncbi:hypothetical protein LP421_21780 [Rhizobium sp. RCAM05350]|nr:hypothetical protein LP421_21780 [Rhizobium sp. RCAM05350]
MLNFEPDRNPAKGNFLSLEKRRFFHHILYEIGSENDQVALRIRFVLGCMLKITNISGVFRLPQRMVNFSRKFSHLDSESQICVALTHGVQCSFFAKIGMKNCDSASGATPA